MQFSPHREEDGHARDAANVKKGKSIIEVLKKQKEQKQERLVVAEEDEHEELFDHNDLEDWHESVSFEDRKELDEEEVDLSRSEDIESVFEASLPRPPELSVRRSTIRES